MANAPTSLVDILRWRAANQPQRLAYRFLVDGEFEEITMPYGELDRRARSIAASLQSVAKPGDRALLLFPPGLDFVAAYFGCLYAQVIAIPAYPPHAARIEKTLPVVRRIVADARPSVALLTTALFNGFATQKPTEDAFRELKWLATDGDEGNSRAEDWQQPIIGGNDLAFLQYTSGSTSAPRGVMVSHHNLLHNLGLIERAFGLSDNSHTVFWLPPYHDMGLIGGILQALYSGYPVTLISQMMFLQRPVRWLQAISRFRATCSGGPNFAYDLCLRKVKPEQREQLDLSSWKVAFNGAEPVYHKTLDQFADYFAPCGFRREAFLPCYGLAESTLIVSGEQKARPPLIRCLTYAGLEENRAVISVVETDDTRALVSCGPVLSGLKANIVHPETLEPCASDRIGEIWLSGPSVATGYWNKPLESEITFGARIAGSNEGMFMRTGDLGFLYEGELYITGRLKDLIICDGKNHYAHDIEKTAEAAHPAIRPAGCAVFSITREGRESVVIIAEVEYKMAGMAADAIKNIRQAVAAEHEVPVSDIKLIAPGGIPRTTSGKIRRFLCKTNYMAGTLAEITLTL